MTDRIIRLPEVIKMTGLSRSSIYAYKKDGTFPKTVKIGQRSVGWVEAQVTEWISEQVLKAQPVPFMDAAPANETV